MWCPQVCRCQASGRGFCSGAPPPSQQSPCCTPCGAASPHAHAHHRAEHHGGVAVGLHVLLTESFHHVAVRLQEELREPLANQVVAAVPQEPASVVVGDQDLRGPGEDTGLSGSISDPWAPTGGRPILPPTCCGLAHTETPLGPLCLHRMETRTPRSAPRPGAPPPPRRAHHQDRGAAMGARRPPGLCDERASAQACAPPSAASRVPPHQPQQERESDRLPSPRASVLPPGRSESDSHA